MSSARIVVEPSLLRAGSIGPATADIRLVVEDISFPMHRWNDFAIVILAAFAEAVVRLRGASKRESVHFMEGSYRVDFQAIANHEWTIELIAEEVADVGAVYGIDTASFLESICSSSARALDAGRQRGIWARDEETLQRLLDRMYSARN